jgi:plastocyanin
MKRLTLILAAAALVVVACGDDDATTTTTPATPTTAATTPTTGGPGAGAAVTVQGFAFSPDDLTVSAGTTVTWTNQDGFDHTTSADDDTWNGALSGGGGSFEFTFHTAGTFEYHCNIHPTMTGTITVEG